MKNIKRIIRKVIKENDWDETGFEDSPYSSEGDYLDSLDTYDESDVYLQFYYSTGEEDYGDGQYDDGQYVEGLLMSHIPRNKFIDIMGTEPEGIEEVDVYSNKGGELLNLMTIKSYLSINTKTGRHMKPDIQYGWTQGVINIIPKEEWVRTYNRNTGRWAK